MPASYLSVIFPVLSYTRTTGEQRGCGWDGGLSGNSSDRFGQLELGAAGLTLAQCEAACTDEWRCRYLSRRVVPGRRMRASELTLACVSACSSPIVERNGVVFGGVCRGFWDCTGAALGASWFSYQKQSQFYPAEWSESCTLDPDYSVRFLSVACGLVLGFLAAVFHFPFLFVFALVTCL